MNEAVVLTPERILEATEDVLRRFGLAKATVVDVARALDVSHGSVYRHFPSKAKMFEGLIGFIEDTLFSRVKLITQSGTDAGKQCEQILILLLAFVEKNPGMGRILAGDALAGETERLRIRVSQLFDRLETQLKTILREAEVREGLRTQASPAVTANLLLAASEGRIRQFVRSDFKLHPTAGWEDQWPLLSQALFRS